MKIRKTIWGDIGLVKQFDIAILIDTQNDNKPVALWATDYNLFERYFIDRYDLMEYFDVLFDDFDFKNMNREEWWDYWSSQGNMLWYLAGPYRIDKGVTIPEFMAKWEDNLSGLILYINRKKIILHSF